MLMPKASVNEDDCSVARQNNVWAPRKVPTMQAKPVPEPMEKRAHPNFRLRVRTADPAHDVAPLGGAVTIAHDSNNLLYR